MDEDSEEIQACIPQAAPAVLVPHDLLSMVFWEACREDWAAAFVLGKVCRAWRRSMLDTPQAWSIIPLHRLKSTETMQMVLDRSAPYPFHVKTVSVNPVKGSLWSLDSRRPVLDGISKHRERCVCLNLQGEDLTILHQPFANLTKLSVSAGGFKSKIGGAIILDRINFPKLRSLSSGSWLNKAFPTVLSGGSLPPIEELNFTTNEPIISADLIKGLAPLLTRLSVCYSAVVGRNAPRAEPIDITFPRLVHLGIEETRNVFWVTDWPFRARTPVLNSYSQEHRQRTLNIHGDTQTVTKLRFHGALNFELFPRLREVWALLPWMVVFVEAVERRVDGWPELETLGTDYESKIMPRIELLNRDTGRNIAIGPRKGLFKNECISPCEPGVNCKE